MGDNQQKAPLSAGDFHGRLALDWERKYEERATFKARERMLMGLLKRLCRPGSAWLDAGCGTGRFSRRLAELGAGSVLGLDAALPMLEVGKKLVRESGLEGRVRFDRIEDLSRLPLPDQSLDGVLCSSVLEYLPDPDRVLREFRRVLKPGGALIVSVPNRRALVRIVQNVCFNVTRSLFRRPWPPYLMLVRNQYTRAETRELISRSGLRIRGMEFGGSGFRADRLAFWGPLLFVEAERAHDSDGAATESADQPEALVLTRKYFPAFKAGGPIQSLHALSKRLFPAIRFKVVTLDRDSGDTESFEGVASNQWTERDGTEVLYLSPHACTGAAVRRIVRGTPHDLVYLNSLFDPVFTLAALWGRARGSIPRRPILLAPRGELQAGALAQKRAKKRAFLWLARRIGLYRGLHWQASWAGEKADILREFGHEPGIAARIHVCRDMASAPADQAPTRDPKRAGHLRAVFVSRITPKKNLEGAIAMLARVAGAVTLDVIGPVSDPAYWSACQTAAARAGLAMNHRGALPHEEVVGALAGYDVFVFPTRGENFGHVVLEALLAGCPTVVSDAAPWQGLEDAQAGWVLPLADEARWLAVLDRLAGMAEPEHAAWRAGARRLGAQVLADGQPAADHAHMFESVLSDPADRSIRSNRSDRTKRQGGPDAD